MGFRGTAFFLAFALTMLGSLLSQAAPVDVPVGAKDKVFLKGLNAQVSYNVQPGTPSLRITGLEEAGWTWEKSGEQIHLMGPQADSRRGLGDQMKSPGKRAVIEITGASVPIEIHLRDGVVNLNRGSHEATVSLRAGKLTAIGRSGSLKSHVMKGETFISDGSGRLDVDLYQGNLTLRNLQVDGEASLFGGQLLVENSRGNLGLSSIQATTKVQKFTGTLNVENGKGAWTGTSLQGRVEGASGEGSMSLQLAGESDVNFKSQSGRISVQLPKASGAALNLVTREGDISVPSEVQVSRGTSEKSVKGRLRGEAGKMSVTLRSQEGSLVVR